MQYVRKGGIKENISTRGDLEYHPRLLLEEEGIKASKQMQYVSSQKLHWDH